MNTDIIVALIGVAGGIITIVIGKISFTKVTSLFFRSQHNIPDIKGSWSCKWFYDDKDEPLEDEVEIAKWAKDSRFKGMGHLKMDIDGQRRVFNYPVEGEISPARVVVLTYKADKYPTQGNIGTASLQLDVRGENMSGHWCGLGSGRTDDGTRIAALRYGRVECTKMA